VSWPISGVERTRRGPETGVPFTIWMIRVRGKIGDRMVESGYQDKR
jgi:hypothetical protein